MADSSVLSAEETGALNACRLDVDAFVQSVKTRSQLMNKWVVHVSQPYDIYIGRPSPFGNPFVIGKDGTREQVIAKFEAKLRSDPEQIRIAKRFLKGKILGCYCAPKPCHGDVLAQIANEES